MANVKELTKQNFDKEVLNAEGGSVLVDFWRGPGAVRAECRDR